MQEHGGSPMYGSSKSKGLVTVAIMVVCLLVGAGVFYFTKKPDSPLEQAAESILKMQGVDIDFSESAKTEDS